MTTKRFFGLDVVRGLAIMVLVVVHRVHYHWTGMQDGAALGRYFSSLYAPLLILTIVLFSMAGIFYLVSGTVNVLAAYRRVVSGQAPVGIVVRGGVASGLWLIVVNYLQRLFFMNGFAVGANGREPEFPVGLLSGFVRYGTLPPFRWSQITEPGTLSLIGLILIIVSLLMGLLLRNNGYRHPQRIYRILIGLGAIALLASPFLKFWLMPIYLAAYESGKYGLAWLLGHLCQEFSLCPYLGYGLFGAVVGIGLARGEALKEIRGRGYKLALVLVVVGIAGLLIGNRSDPLGSRVMGAGISYVELALFLFLTGLALRIWDYGEDAGVERRRRRFKTAERFGRVALTVFFAEPFVAAIAGRLLDAVAGAAWANSMLLVIAFGLVLLAAWSVLLRQWEKSGYVGSIEWLSARVLRIVAGKESGKTRDVSLRTPELSA